MSREAPVPGPPNLASNNSLASEGGPVRPKLASNDSLASEGGRHLLLWDGTCGFCRRSVEWIARHDTRARLLLLPYQDAPASLVSPQLRAACARAMHVLTTDGRVLKAGRASLFVLGEIGWPLAARVLAWPPFLWAVELGYRLVADNRGRLSRWLPGPRS